MVQRDLGAMQQAVNSLRAEVTQLRNAAAALPRSAPAMHGYGVQNEDDAIVGIHPITGRGVTAKQLKDDPKLAMRMKFSEADE